VSSPEAPRRDPRNEDRPRDPFERRIEEAARSLKRKAPDLLAAIRERVSDLDASIETAARANASKAPLELLDVRIAAAARELRKPAPAHLHDEVFARARRGAFALSRGRLLVLRRVAAAAAVLIATAFLLFKLTRPKESENPALLTSSALAQSLADEARLDREADRLEDRVRDDAALATNEAAGPLLEEVAFLDQAIAECKQALAISQAHSHLRERLVELTGQRVDLLRQIEAAGRTGGDESGEPRG
jgi:hypothetical protein